MRVLLDENVPRKLKSRLEPEYNIKSPRSPNRVGRAYSTVSCFELRTARSMLLSRLIVDWSTSRICADSPCVS